MLENVTATPFLGLFLILVCWIIGVKLQKKTGWLVCNPVLTSSCMIVLILMATGIPLDHFRTGGSLISMLLGPATAVLALTIYRQKLFCMNISCPSSSAAPLAVLSALPRPLPFAIFLGPTPFFRRPCSLRALRQPLRWVFPKAGAGFPALRRQLSSLRESKGPSWLPSWPDISRSQIPLLKALPLGLAAMPLAR